jgi:hypothetical protein
MYIASENITNLINSPMRKIVAKAELYNGSALLKTFSYNDAIKSIDIERIGEESKFFGFGVCQKLIIKLIDTKRELDITTANSFNVCFGSEEELVNTCAKFYVTEVKRDENTNELSITAYDAINAASAHTVAELNLSSYTIREFAAAAAELFGLELEIRGVGADETCFNTYYSSGANFDGTEAIRDALTAIAEVTQTIYYVNCEKLIFKRLDKDGAPALTIDKSKYFTLDSGENRILTGICHATELGDNVIASLSASGTTQYVRNNPFWDMREDVASLVDKAIATVGGFAISQFDCSWRGNFLLEIGDKIAVTTKDDGEVISYVINDVVNYNGAFKQKTKWSYTENNNETAANPSTLGDAINLTFAKVDKVKQEITMAISDIDANNENISALQLTASDISAKVSSMETVTNDAINGINDSVAELTKTVETKLTDEEVTIKITDALSNGVSKVETSTGFTFDETGLTVSKSDSEISTTITENGMTVNKNNNAVLTANADGVEAIDLKASTYLIIGTNSRFEDYDNKQRTGCFWIGG